MDPLQCPVESVAASQAAFHGQLGLDYNWCDNHEQALQEHLQHHDMSILRGVPGMVAAVAALTNIAGTQLVLGRAEEASRAYAQAAAIRCTALIAAVKVLIVACRGETAEGTEATIRAHCNIIMAALCSSDWEVKLQSSDTRSDPPSCAADCEGLHPMCG